MNYKSLFLIIVLSSFLYGCGGGGGSSSNATASSTCSSPTVTLSSTASSIYESASGTISIKATLSCAASENVVVTLGTSGTATEGTDYSNVSNITITAGSTTCPSLGTLRPLRCRTTTTTMPFQYCGPHFPLSRFQMRVTFRFHYFPLSSNYC